MRVQVCACYRVDGRHHRILAVQERLLASAVVCRALHACVGRWLRVVVCVPALHFVSSLRSRRSLGMHTDILHARALP
jgi:hypothetical protein